VFYPVGLKLLLVQQGFHVFASEIFFFVCKVSQIIQLRKRNRSFCVLKSISVNKVADICIFLPGECSFRQSFCIFAPSMPTLRLKRALQNLFDNYNTLSILLYIIYVKLAFYLR